MGRRSEWTAEQITQLRTLRALGLGSGAIGRALGCTRNAVIGKCKREGIPSMIKPHTSAEPKSKAPKVLQIKAPMIPPPPPAPIVFADACEPVAMQALRYLGQCKWSVSDGLFCGREAETVWCDAHKRIVFQQQKRA